MKSRCLLVLLLHFAFCSALLAQQKVTGMVKDKDEKPVAGASIQFKGFKSGTTTNEEGKFSISFPANTQKAVLVISSVGFAKSEIKVVPGQSILSVLTTNNGNNLNDVVIVGYQKQSVRKSTSAIQIISGREIENLPAPSFEQLLQGKVSGVNIQNFSGEPGVRNTFTIRGNSNISTDLNDGSDEARTLSTPLYVIDGIPLSINDIEGISSTGTNFLAGININDIESISVQKDAAATSAWGSRGANGVVVIKTKRGKTGKPQYRFSYYTGITQKPQLLRTVVGAEERHQKLGLLNEYGSYNDLSDIPQILTDSLNPAFNNATDWQDLFYKTGRVDNADLSIAAGNDLLNYRLGVNYYNEGGIVRNTGFKRYSLRGNFDFKIAKNLNAIVNLSLSRLDRKRGLGRGRNESLPIKGGFSTSLFLSTWPV